MPSDLNILTPILLTLWLVPSFTLYRAVCRVTSEHKISSQYARERPITALVVRMLVALSWPLLLLYRVASRWLVK